MVLRSNSPVPLVDLRAAITAAAPAQSSLQPSVAQQGADPQGEGGQAIVAVPAQAEAVPGAVFDQIDLAGPHDQRITGHTGYPLSLAALAMLGYICASHGISRRKLTLIGCSITDKVVVYDRIGEHLRRNRGVPPVAVIDRCLPGAVPRLRGGIA